LRPKHRDDRNPLKADIVSRVNSVIDSLSGGEIDGVEVSFDHFIGAHNDGTISRLNRLVCNCLHGRPTAKRIADFCSA
jgi:hypothetical protein